MKEQGPNQLKFVASQNSPSCDRDVSSAKELPVQILPK